MRAAALALVVILSAGCCPAADERATWLLARERQEKAAGRFAVLTEDLLGRAKHWGAVCRTVSGEQRERAREEMRLAIETLESGVGKAIAVLFRAGDDTVTMPLPAEVAACGAGVAQEIADLRAAGARLGVITERIFTGTYPAK